MGRQHLWLTGSSANAKVLRNLIDASIEMNTNEAVECKAFYTKEYVQSIRPRNELVHLKLKMYEQQNSTSSLIFWTN